MATLRIPTPLRAYTSGKSEVNVSGARISEALADLTTQYPAIKPHLFNEGDELRPFVNLFLGENNIKDLQGMNTPIGDGDKLVLIPSIAGGCHCEEEPRRGDDEAISRFEKIASQYALATTFVSGG